MMIGKLRISKTVNDHLIDDKSPLQTKKPTHKYFKNRKYTAIFGITDRQNMALNYLYFNSCVIFSLNELKTTQNQTRRKQNYTYGE